MPLTVRPAELRDREHWLRLREALWPGALPEHDAATQRYFDIPDYKLLTLVADVDGQIVGFLELSERSVAESCESSPVPFIEGWYVIPEARRQGVGKSLTAAAEEHARRAGYREIASDAQIGNAEGIAAHLAVGYEEVERVVCFRKALRIL